MGGGGCVWTDYLISWYVLILCDDDSTVVMYKCAETTTERVLYSQGEPFFYPLLETISNRFQQEQFLINQTIFFNMKYILCCQGALVCHSQHVGSQSASLQLSKFHTV